MLLRKTTKSFRQNFKQLKKSSPLGWQLYKSYRYDVGDHPIDYKILECAFISSCLNLPPNSKILNVGSYLDYVAGLLAIHQITSLDIRPRPVLINHIEDVIVGDAKELSLPDNTFDAIITTSAIEHFGLGRYGDSIDINADVKAFNQFKRILRCNGLLLFTTTIKQGKPEILFNANKTYNIDIINNFCHGLEKIVEMFIKKSKLEFCNLNEVTKTSKTWDIYCGCWRKPL